MGRPGEIFALTWSRLTSSYVDIRQRVYRGKIDMPKTNQSIRRADLSEGLLRDIEAWRRLSLVTREDAWVFPSERMTPMSKENWWNRNIKPRLISVGLGWANFQVMRRTHATLINELGVNGKLVADQLGHSLDVSKRLHAVAGSKSSAGGEPAREKAIGDVIGAQTEHRLEPANVNC
jgi:integrase